MKYLLLFVCFFGSLLIGPAVSAQKNRPPLTKKTTTTVADSKYGEGGTLDSTSDEKLRLLSEIWKDKDGKIREIHSLDIDDFLSESWGFFESTRYVIYEMTHHLANTVNQDGQLEKTWDGTWDLQGPNRQSISGVSKDEIGKVIEGIEKQFAKDGTLPDLTKKTAKPEEKPKEVVEQSDLDKQRKAFIDAEEAQADAQKRAELKARCDGLRDKIRALQDLVRKRQEDPASPKQELETMRKQIDDLLSQLADCPKQEPIDVQFDCLKSKFPGIQRSSDKKDAASDPTSKREFAWDNDKQAWIDKDTKESICPPSEIDPCLVGTWECTSFKEANKFITGGGTGFRVTFKSDGTETVDYSKMQPIRAGNDKMVYEGKATARISTKDGVAKIEKMIEAGVTFDAAFMVKRYGKEWNPKLPELGPGGLGTTKGKNNYKCTGDSLEYQSSTPRGDADCTVKLTKVKQ